MGKHSKRNTQKLKINNDGKLQGNKAKNLRGKYA
jgi:hypothetical protein